MAMAIFKPAEVNDQQLDWIILRDGGVQLYWRDEILSDDLRWLKSNGYKIIFFDAAEWRSGSEWESQRRMHESLKDKLSFPDYYGENLDALDECIVDDLVVPDNGSHSYSTTTTIFPSLSQRWCSIYSQERCGITCSSVGDCYFSCSQTTPQFSLNHWEESRQGGTSENG
jgi:hypothetical protein